MRVLVTGMCGFIGHYVAAHLLQNTDWSLVGLDRLDATSTLHRLRHVPDWPSLAHRVSFVWHDLRAEINRSVDQQIGPIDAVLHLAASTHVDRSIAEPLMFVFDNTVGTAHLLDWWRRRLKKNTALFVNFGTDEVFGPAAPNQSFNEWDRYRSANPYSASKAGAEELACAFSNTYGLRIIATHAMNVFGERQHPEKFIPNTIRKILNNEKIIIHADPTGTQSGTRFYQHAANAAAALQWLIEHSDKLVPQEGSREALFEKCNLVGEHEVSNLDMAKMIAKIVGAPLNYVLVDANTSRPGHDFRYALDGTKLRNLGFCYPMSFEESLERAVNWYLNHPTWLEH
jgi:dTDP-glucose 4,6-dehydratase